MEERDLKPQLSTIPVERVSRPKHLTTCGNSRVPGTIHKLRGSIVKAKINETFGFDCTSHDQSLPADWQSESLLSEALSKLHYVMR